MSQRITHAALVKRAARWLRKVKNCGIVVTELVTSCEETPDAIGWYCGQFSYAVECKVSRSDFRADAAKRHRMNGQSAGQKRYMLTPAGLLSPDELPDGWGLLEWDGRGDVREIRDATRVTGGEAHEIRILCSTVRRRAIESNILVYEHDEAVE